MDTQWSADEIASIRTRLDLTASELARLLGVTPSKVRQWEQGLESPPPDRTSILAAFRMAAMLESDVGVIASDLLRDDRVALALYTLLKAAFEPEADAIVG